MIIAPPRVTQGKMLRTTSKIGIQDALCVLRYHLIKKSDSNSLLTEALSQTLPDFFSKVSSFLRILQ